MNMDPAVEWLLEKGDPAVKLLTLTDVLGKNARSRSVQEAKKELPKSPWIGALLRGQKRDGGFGNHPYTKWTGAHWRLVSLVELGATEGHHPALKVTDSVLQMLNPDGGADPTGAGKVNGLVLRHASIEGNALAACVRLGRSRDPQVKVLVERLLDSQWPDGGWNCDKRATGEVSSFYETITPMWGLSEYAGATGNADARSAAERAAEFFLERRLFRGRRTGRVIDPRWPKLHYPLYWHYDILHALVLISRVVGLKDARVNEALDLVESKRQQDRTWRAEGSYWNPPGKARSVDVVDWGRRGPNQMITLNALRVLTKAGRIDPFNA